MGTWQLAALANILGCKIVSVHPLQGLYINIANKVFVPRITSVDTLKEIHIMWTSCRDDMVKEHWVPNHVVPLMHMVDPNHIVSIEEEPSRKRLGTVIVGQIRE